MKLVFDGTIEVSSAVSREKSYLLFEIGKGSGKAGEFTTDPARFCGAEVDIAELCGLNNVVLFEFSTASSIAVVMEKLQALLMHQLKMPLNHNESAGKTYDKPFAGISEKHIPDV